MNTRERDLIGYAVEAGQRNGAGADGRIVEVVRGAQAVAAIAVASRCDHPHLLAVLDVGTAPNGDVVAVVPACDGRLDDLLASRSPAPGEAVTVLAPIADALAAMHGCGVALGGLTAGHIRFDEMGAPMLAPATTPVIAETHGDAAFEEAAAADDAAIATLACVLLAGHPIVDRIRRLRPDAGALGRLVLAAAAPTAIGSAAGASHGFPDAPGRLIPVASGEDAPRLRRERSSTAWDRFDDDGSGTPAARPARASPRMQLAPARVTRFVAAVRPRTWLLAGTVAALLVAALIWLPTGGAGAAQETVGTAPAVSASASGTATSSASSPGQTADPLLAISGLLGARAACLERGRADCIAAVDAQGSPVDMQDRAAIAAGTVPTRPRGTARVLSRTGGAVTAEVGSSLVLITLGHGGWLLRDVVPEG